jgi:hypothetical protein
MIHDATGGHGPRREPPRGVVPGDTQGAAGAGDPPELIEAAQWVAGMLQHGDAEHLIEGAVPIWEGMQIADGHLDAVGAKTGNG